MRARACQIAIAIHPAGRYADKGADDDIHAAERPAQSMRRSGSTELAGGRPSNQGCACALRVRRRANYRCTAPRAWILWPPTPSHATCATCRILCATPRWVAQLQFASSILLFGLIVLRALKIFRYFRSFVRFRVAMILFSNRHK